MSSSNSPSALQQVQEGRAAWQTLRKEKELWIKEFEHVSHTAKAECARRDMGNAIKLGDKWDANYLAKWLGRTTWIAEMEEEIVKCLRVELKALSAKERGAQGQDEVEWEDI
eukprot:1148851-Pelagomonas_calceolata.AAC.1